MNNPHTDRFQRKLDRIGRFAHISENQLAVMAADLDARLDAESQSFPESERQEFFESNLEDSIELSDSLPTIIRYAVLTGADTALEVYLHATCDAYAEVHSPRVLLSDLKGAGIERAKSYLKKVVGLPFPDSSPTWTDIIRLHELRNCVVHADGQLPEGRATLREWCRKSEHVYLNFADVVALRSGFIDFALASYESFATDFDAACKDLDLWKTVFPLEIEDI